MDELERAAVRRLPDRQASGNAPFGSSATGTPA